MDYRVFQVLKVNVPLVKQVRIKKKFLFYLRLVFSLDIGIKGAIGEPGLPGPSGIPGPPGERGFPGGNGKKTYQSNLYTSHILFQDLLVYRVNE